MTLAVAATVSACGGGDANNGGGGAGDSSTQRSESPAAALSVETLKTISQYTGVPSGKATKAPIRVGFINTEAGPGASPEYAIVTDEAVRSVNEYFGGINGHPIELKKCQPTNTAQSQQCARDFAADPAMVVVLQGTVDTDVEAFHTTLTPKIPVIGALPLSPFDAQAQNSYYLSSGQFGTLGVVTYATQYAKAKSVALMVAGGFAAAELAIATIKNAMEASGITVTVATFPFDATDLTPYIAASKAKDADLFMPAVSSPTHCVALSKSLQQLGVDTPVLTFTGCLGDDVRKSLGDYPRWSFLGFSVSAEASATDDVTAWQVRAFNEWFAPLEARSVTRNAGVQMFQTVLTAVKIVASVPGDAPSAAAVGAQAQRFTGPVFLGVPRLSFGAIPGLPAIGSLASRVYVYLGNGSWRDTTAGVWLEPPALARQPRR